MDAVKDGDPPVRLLLPREQSQARKRNKTLAFSGVFAPEEKSAYL
jgi:hypothetical protein